MVVPARRARGRRADCGGAPRFPACAQVGAAVREYEDLLGAVVDYGFTAIIFALVVVVTLALLGVFG